MKRLNVRSVLGCLVVAAAPCVTSAAQPEARYYCEINTYGHGGWVPREALFEFPGDGETVVVLDPFLLAVEEGPVSTSYKQRKNGTLRFGWTLTLSAKGGVKYDARYRVDLDTAKLSGRIKANISGIRNGRMGGLLKCQMDNGT